LKNHFERLSNNGIEAIYLVSDEGAGIRAGHAKVMNDKLRQSNTYHGIAYNLGSWVGRLESAAYAAIKKEYEEKRPARDLRNSILNVA
jgi:hypothetical protein